MALLLETNALRIAKTNGSYYQAWAFNETIY